MLCVCGKIFECILYNNLYRFLTTNKLLSPKQQSGFKSGDSCINQLLAITHNIHKSLDQGYEVRGVFLDISKAFDRVWHEGLIFKLKKNGIGGNFLNVLTNFLTLRKKRVVLNGQASTWKNIDAGVPQGSILGPLLFLIYIYDLSNNPESEIKLFSDDTFIFSIVHDNDLSTSELENDLNIIQEWAHQWKMCFNPDPTKPAEEVVFSVKRSKPYHPPLLFNGEEVKKVKDHKHLGLILDSKLNFISHINEKITRARKGIGKIRKLSPYVQIYKLHVRSHLDYCDIIFHRPKLLNEANLSITYNCYMAMQESVQ